MNVKEHANTRFTKQDHALNQSFHVSTEELTSQAIKDVSACRATFQLVSSAKKVLKAVVVCMKGFSVFFFLYYEMGAFKSRFFKKPMHACPHD